MPKDTQMNNQAIRTMTKQTQKQGSFYRNHFAEHNYNYVNRPQTTISSRTNTQNHLFSQSQILQQPSTNSVNFHDCPQSSQDQSENYPFLQQNKRIHNEITLDIKHLTIHLIIFHQTMRNTIIRIINNFIKTKDIVLTTWINQIILNRIHKKNI